MERQEVRELLKEKLRDYVEKITTRSKGANLYVCPICGSGTGKNRSGAFSLKNNTSWKCFSCGAGGDIFDLYGAVNRTPDHNEQYMRLCDMYGLDTSINGTEYQKQDKTERYTHNNIHTSVYTDAEARELSVDYTDFFLQAKLGIDRTDYWMRRGLSKETVERFNIGYVEEWKHPNAPSNAPLTPRLIIPTSSESYLARDTRETIPAEQKPYSKMKVGSIHFFNEEAFLKSSKPIFIVEGELDALSIIEVGGEAVALGTTTKVKALTNLLKEAPPSQPIVIALDNDEAGERASKELATALSGINIKHFVYNLFGEYKDANEALVKNRDAFALAVAEAGEAEAEESRAEKEAYKRTSTAHHLMEFINGISENANTPYIPTGFSKLDGVLDGGLYEGLYIIGAISSLGKTTLVLQIADQIASSGNDVLIFSLEMARTEIMAKSLSRHTLQTIIRDGGEVSHAKTSRGITTGKRYKYYNDEELKVIGKAINDYGEYACNLYINEGIGDIGVDEIRQTVDRHIRCTGKTPVVIIDYLQILAPYNERATDKQNTDKAVMELKRISRDYKTPVIGISSFNRASYKEAVTMEAFKESGAIEYSSDVLMGLQLKGAGTASFDVNEAKRKDVREIELVILKNRNGRTGDSLSFKFYPMFNYFEEARQQ